MRFFTLLILSFTIAVSQFPIQAFAQNEHRGISASGHEMQHGFIISDDDSYFNHLVATGHHSHQLSLSGTLVIHDNLERHTYLAKKIENRPRKTYFVFQAQKLNLPSTNAGQVLRGHIIESSIGDYQPKQVIVKEAEIQVQKVDINVPNPFFAESISDPTPFESMSSCGYGKDCCVTQCRPRSMAEMSCCEYCRGQKTACWTESMVIY